MRAKLIIGAMFFLWASRLFGADYQFKTIAMPEARQTMAFGINDLGEVVGVFADCELCQLQAFLFSDSQYYEIAAAGALRLTPFGINKAGIIAGTLINQGQFAFVMDDANTTILDQAVRADAINSKGAVVGYQSTPTLNQVAYTWKAGKYTPLVTPADVPGILGSAATGVNDQGDVVGYWFKDAGDGINVTITGFLLKDGRLTPVADLIPLGINKWGQMVGLSGAGNDGAFRDENGVMSLIKVPGADMTQVHGLNNVGHLVGYYMKAGQIFGFTAIETALSKSKRKRALEK